ncbi:MAG: hypothetical protein R3Y64_09935 [Peptostreptococcaceae bacterium]
MGAKKIKKCSHSYINSKLIKNEINDIQILKYEEYFKYYKELHNAKSGFVSLMKVDKVDKANTGRWSLNINDIDSLSIFQDEDDFYCSVNTLIAPGKHKSKDVVKLNALFVDLDYYNDSKFKELTPEQMVQLLELELNYPIPSLYIDSGRGIYVLWLLNNTYATSGSKKFWKRIEEEIIQVFKDFSVDEKVKDMGRVLRVLGSKNSKNGRIVKIIKSANFELCSNIDNPIRYELSDFSEFFWGDKYLSKRYNGESKDRNKNRNKNRNKKKIFQLKNTYTLSIERYKDLERIVEMRSNRIEKGWREHLLFLYRLNLLYSHIDPSKALDMTLELNSKLGIPMEEKELISATSNTDEISIIYHRLLDTFQHRTNDRVNLSEHMYNGGAFLYKNTTIIKMLGITAEEQEQLSTIIGTDEKNRRKSIRNKEWYQENKKYYKRYYSENKAKISENKQNNYRNKLQEKNKLSRDEQNKIKQSKIKDLMDQGKKQKEIADILMIGISTVKRYAKIIKNN